MATKKYRDGIDFLKLMSLFADTNNPKKELDYIYFSRADGVFVATDTRMMVIVTPKGTTAESVYDGVFPHFNSENRLEVLTKKGIGMKLNGTYPDWKRILPKGDGIVCERTSSMWATTIKQNIILNVIDNQRMQKALSAIGVYDEGFVSYSTPNSIVMYEVERIVRYGTEYGDFFDALIQVIVMPIVGLGE